MNQSNDNISVFWVLYWDVDLTVHDAVDMSMCTSVRWAVDRAVHLAVHRALYDGVSMDWR